MLIGTLPYVIISEWIVNTDGDPHTYLDLNKGDYVGINPLLYFTLINSQFLFWLLGLYVAVRFIHKRKFTSLITPNRKIDWKRIGFGFLTYFVILSMTTIIDCLLNPGNYSFNDSRVSDFLILFVLCWYSLPFKRPVRNYFSEDTSCSCSENGFAFLSFYLL